MGSSSTSPWVLQSCRLWGALYVGRVGPCVVALVTTVGMLAGTAGPNPIGCKPLPSPEAARFCWIQPDPGMTGCKGCGILVLVLTHWWLGPDPGTNTLEGGFQNDACQHRHPHGGTDFRNDCQCLYLPHEAQLPPASP